MNVIVCVDNSLGMLFNNRRQSRDSVVINKILEISEGDRLLICEFSRSLFSDGCNCVVDNDFLLNAENGDFCFVENRHLLPYEDKIEKLFIFKWNRDYPGDFFVDITLDRWKLLSASEFEGNSHKSITLEVYSK